MIERIQARLSVSMIGDTAHLLTLQRQPEANGLTLRDSDGEPAEPKS